MQIIIADDDGNAVAVYPGVTPADADSTKVWTIVNWLVSVLKGAQS